MLKELHFRLVSILLCSLFLGINVSYGQQVRSATARPLLIPKDSMIVRSVRALQHQVNLSDDQASQVLHLRKRLDERLDSLRQVKSSSIEERGKQYKTLNDDYNAALRKVLNEQQYKGYRDMVKVQRDTMQARMQRMHIKVKEIEDHN